MSVGVSIIVNEDGTMEILQDNKGRPIREKGESLISIPSNYTVVDIETTGFDPRYDEIIEVGALKIREGKIIDQFESLIQPDGYYLYDDDGNESFYYVDEFITELTGITNEMLSKAPTLEKVLPRFIEFINDDILLGHNVHFDINFLYDVLMEHLDYKLSNDMVDLLRLSRKVFPDFKNHKLETISINLGVDNSNAHRSLRDCEITYQCFSKLSEHLKANNIIIEDLFKRKYSSGSGKHLDLRTIEAENEDFDEEHLLFNAYCTFTGKLEKMERKDAAQIVVNLGGHCLNSVTKKTNFLILGNFDYNATVKDGKSSKLKKAEQLILNGQDLKILSEDVFYDLVMEKSY
ncbi:MAG: exonuclease domain-containing protein [Tissierellaceae bacterium]|nr:exonuclease domain-containing protein [Tissierellaceae bacterium]